MRAIVFAGVEQVETAEVPEPIRLDPGDAIVEVEYAAICGSDLHIYHGRESGLDLGTVMGHEFVGRVVDPGASGLSRDARVVAPFTTSCGACDPCRRGLSARCRRGELFGWVEQGRGLQGAQAQRVRVPQAATTLCSVPPELDSEIALLAGDVLSTGAYGVERSGAAAGEAVAVLGCGPVGLMAVLVAVARGCTVFAVDRIAERLAFARRLGAVAVSGEDAAAQVIEASAGGVAAVVEASGSPQALRSAYEMLRPGGVLSIVGVHHESSLPLSPGELYDKNLSLRTGRCPARSLMPHVLPLAIQHAKLLRDVFTHRFGLEDSAIAYRSFATRREGCLKVLLVANA
jgi:threonine dehydrogenase-like Zn-dependent dehydrogenase